MKTLRAIIRLSRPLNVAIAALSIYVGAFITETDLWNVEIALACLSGALITAAANTINDYFDVAIDRINRPDRPLPSGALSPPTAAILAAGEYAAGILLSLWINPLAFSMAVIFSALTFVYSARFKRMPLIGNVTVSLSTAAAFIYGAVAVNQPLKAVYPGLFAFFFHLGREIIKDIQDIKGDALNQARTFPIRFGIRRAIWLTKGNFLFLFFLTLLPYFTHYYDFDYFLVIMLGIFPVVLLVLFYLSEKRTHQQLEWLSHLLKLDMLVGIYAIYVGT
ncbi:MAG: UbiA family prenyltransferase [Calditrichaeota bacterium]|nr:UbiA family prenyltransferase [Calditrichota bacterium]